MLFAMLQVAELEPKFIGGVIALSIFLLALLIMRILQARSVVRRRVAAAAAPFGSAAGVRLRSIENGRADRLMARMERFLAPNGREALTQMRRQLVQAGFLSPAAVTLFYGLRTLLAIGLPLTLLASTSLLPVEIPSALIMVFAACGAALGLVLPPVLLDFRIRAMREKYRRVFPDFMDLLIVCIEAGQSLPSALERVSREMNEFCPELGANLHLLNLELRAGSTMTEALHSLHGRLGIDEIQSLAVLLKQSEELGVSIANTLRVYGDEMRDKRLSRAEARANALPVKMTIPLGFFIFPVILLVILTPVVIRIKHAFV